MRVLVLADGSSSHTERYVLELRKQGVHVILASLQTGAFVDVRMKPSRFGQFASYWALQSQLLELVSQKIPDIINSHFASAYGYAASRLRDVLENKTVLHAMHLWGSDILVSPEKSALHRWRVQRALKSANIVFGDSEHLLSAAKGYGAQNTHCHTWGPNQATFATESDLKSQAQWKSDKPVRILAPRRHEPVYRNEIILEALAPLLSDGRVTLTTTESGSQFNSFMMLAQQLRVGNAISTYAGLSHTEYLTNLRGHSLMISASKSDSNPVSVLEAQAVGVIPIVMQFAGAETMYAREDRRRCIVSAETAEALQHTVTAVMNLSEREREWTIMRNFAQVMASGSYEMNIAATIRDMELARKGLIER